MSSQDSFAEHGGLRIAYRSWPTAATARGVVVIVPGFNSHSGYYEAFASQCVANGLSVFAIDLRGRGQSEGERYYVENFDDYVSDVARFIDIAKSRNPGAPLFLLGHSAGGVVACLYALEFQAELRGLICESFAYQVPAPEFALAALKGLSHIAPHAHVLPLKNDDFSRDALRQRTRILSLRTRSSPRKRWPRWFAPMSVSTNRFRGSHYGF